MGEYLPRAHTGRYFYGGLPGMGWLLPHHKMPPSGKGTLGDKTYVTIPPSCPIRPLVR